MMETSSIDLLFLLEILEHAVFLLQLHNDDLAIYSNI